MERIPRQACLYLQQHQCSHNARSGVDLDLLWPERITSTSGVTSFSIYFWDCTASRGQRNIMSFSVISPPRSPALPDNGKPGLSATAPITTCDLQWAHPVSEDVKSKVILSLDHRLFPFIFDEIIAFASSQALVKLRATSRYVRSLVEPILYRHVVVTPANPGSTNVSFYTPDGYKLFKNLSGEEYRNAALACLRHTRVLDSVRHHSDTEDLSCDLDDELTFTDPEWWTACLQLEYLRLPGPRSLWKAYLEDNPEYWSDMYFTDFALEGNVEWTRTVPPAAGKTIYFVDLAPPYLLEGGTKNNYEWRMYSPYLRASWCPPAMSPIAILNVRFDPNHPLLPTVEWFPFDRYNQFQENDSNGPPEQLVFILSPCQPLDFDDECVQGALLPRPWTELCSSPLCNFDEQYELWMNEDICLVDLKHITWRMRRLLRTTRRHKVTFVGLEEFSDDALNFLDPLHRGLPWQQRMELLYERLAATYEPLDEAARNAIGPGMLEVLTRSEYRERVGEEEWHLQTCEPAGPWSDVAACSCRESFAFKV